MNDHGQPSQQVGQPLGYPPVVGVEPAAQDRHGPVQVAAVS
jgi:hypothetical protein